MAGKPHIAHFNVARLLHPPGDPRVAEFVDNIARVNAISERSKGFVWRLDEADAQVARDGYSGVGGDPCIANSLSVWESTADLEMFVRKTLHGAFLRNREKWFAPWAGPNYVIWNFDGTPPVAKDDGWERLKHLAAHGPTPFAYDFAFTRSNQTK
jgi:hypothetical protein